MVGRDLGELFPRVPHEPGEPVLELEDFRAGTRGRPANLEFRRGEILGLAGLVGAGRTRLVRAVFGLEPVVAGRVRVAHVEGGYATPRERIEQGVGYLSEDRKGEGLALGLSIEDNMTYSGLRRHARHGWLRIEERRAEVARWIARLRIAATGPRQPAGGLSGGNQQKVALARLLHQHADVLLLDEPTRGIDVGSKAEIYRLLGELAAQGKAILVVSSYLPELFGICDRIAVMSRGTLSEALPVDRVDRAPGHGSRDPRRGGRRSEASDRSSSSGSNRREGDRGVRASRGTTGKSRRGRVPADPGLGLDGLRAVPRAGADHASFRCADPRVRARS